MPTSLVSTGVQFPDSTIQTTAATAGGTVTATASGSISDGAAAILNSNGTVSAVSITMGTTPTIGTAQNSTPPGSITNLSTFGRQNTIYIPSKNLIVTIVSATGSIKYLWSGSPGAGGTINWSSNISSLSTLPGANSQSCSLVYLSNINRLVITWSNGQQIYYTTYTFDANNTISLLKTDDVIVNTPGYTYNNLCAKYEAFSGRIVWLMQEGANNQLYTMVGSCNASTGVVSTSVGVIFITSVGGGNANHAVNLTSNPANGKVVYLYGNPGSGSQLYAGQISVGSDNVTNLTGPVTAGSGATSSGYSYDIVYDTTNSVYLYYYTDSSGAFFNRAASISGYTLTQGTAVATGTGGSNPSPYGALPSTNQYVYFQGTNFGRSLALSGTTITLTTLTMGTIQNPGIMISDTLGMQYFTFNIQGSTQYSSQTITNVTSTLTSTNLLGFSDAAYTNAQTATIKIVGATKNTFSGLTAGLKYYVTPSGAYNSVATYQPYAGLALNSTTLLIKG